MKFKIGSWYYIKMVDHSKDLKRFDEAILEICGEVEKITKTHVHIIYWKCNSLKNDKEFEHENHDRAVIAISAIISKKKLNI